MAYPLEARLRPAHELGAASVSALGAALVLSSPGLFLLSSPWHLALAGLLLGHAAWRGAAGSAFGSAGTTGISAVASVACTSR